MTHGSHPCPDVNMFMFHVQFGAIDIDSELVTSKENVAGNTITQLSNGEGLGQTIDACPLLSTSASPL